MDPFVTLLEVHKLMYFMQEAGEPLRLEYAQAPYGPYAENLRHVLHAVEGHLIAGYADGGDAPDKQLSSVPGAVRTHRVSRRTRHPRAVRPGVRNWWKGSRRPSVWSCSRPCTGSGSTKPVTYASDEVAGTYAWNERKRRFTPRQIVLPRHVVTRGWLPAPEQPSGREPTDTRSAASNG